jgi:hypothetical protein
LSQATNGKPAAYPAFQIYAYGNAIANEDHQMPQQPNYAAPTKMEVEITKEAKITGTEGLDELPNEICQIPAPY